MPSVSLGGPPQRSRRQVVPAAAADVVVVADDVAQRCQRQRQRVRRDLAHAVIGRIGHPDAVRPAGFDVDGVEAGADPAHDAEFRQRRDDTLR